MQDIRFQKTLILLCLKHAQQLVLFVLRFEYTFKICKFRWKKETKKKKSIILPKETKFKKLHKGRLQFCERKTTATRVYYGLYGLKILKSTRLESTQLDAARKQISRQLKRYEFLWIRAIPDIPVTKKPNEVRMGKGKGAPEHWVARTKAGQTIFELTCMLPRKAQVLLLTAAKKLSIPCAIINHSKKIN